MTDFFTLCWRSCRTRLAALVWLAVAAVWLGLPAAAQNETPEVVQFRVEREEEGLLLSALVRLELTPVVEDALLKGVPMFFLAETEIFRSRWYWYDQKVTATSKGFRLAYYG